MSSQQAPAPLKAIQFSKSSYEHELNDVFKMVSDKEVRGMGRGSIERVVKVGEVDNQKVYFMDRLESITRFPSIPTFNKFVQKGGILGDEVNDIVAQYEDAEFTLTEKLDGTNVRIIITNTGPDGAPEWFIGVRREFIMMQGSPLFKDTNTVASWFLSRHGGVPVNVEGVIRDEHYDALYHKFFHIDPTVPDRVNVVVLYGEMYGGNIQKGKKHYGGENPHFRLFASQVIENAQKALWGQPEMIAGYRERFALGHWKFVTPDNRKFTPIDFLWSKDTSGLQHSKLTIHHPFDAVPLLGEETLPVGEPLENVYSWLQEKVGGKTRGKIGEDGDGRSEGLVAVLNDGNSSPILTKFRLEDYERTLRKMGKL